MLLTQGSSEHTFPTRGSRRRRREVASVYDCTTRAGTMLCFLLVECMCARLCACVNECACARVHVHECACVCTRVCMRVCGHVVCVHSTTA